MGVASLILGILALVASFVPCVGLIAIVPAGIGIILGIIDAISKSKKQESKGMPVTGIILSIISLIVAYVMTSATVSAVEEGAQQIKAEAGKAVQQMEADMNKKLEEAKSLENQL